MTNTSASVPSKGKGNNTSDPYDELNRLVGLIAVKKEIMKKKALVEGGLQLDPGHYVFMGNPGTGKTEVARLMGMILKNLGLLKSGHIVIVSRNDLESDFVGGTAKNTAEMLDKAKGGILFVDEAYWMTDPNSRSNYGKETYDLIMQRMEDDRHEFTVIFSGYKDKMEQFLFSNPGLKARITSVLCFPDYTEAELYQILLLMASERNYILDAPHTEAARIIIHFWLLRKDKHFGNAREVIDLLDKWME